MPKRNSTIRFALAVLAGCGVGTYWDTSHAAVFIPVWSFEDTLPTAAYDINDNDVITGTYNDSNGPHGFFGTLSGSYTSFDYGGSSTGTYAYGINDDGWIVGSATVEGYFYGYQFLRKPDGTLATVTRYGSPLDGYPNAIIGKEKFVGTYLDGNSYSHAYFGRAGRFGGDVVLPFLAWNSSATGMNRNGVIVGWFDSHGFVIQNGFGTQIDYPDPTAIETVLNGINDNGLVTGFWIDNTAFNSHAFTFDLATNTFTPIIVGILSSAAAWGLNKAGMIAITAGPASYIYCPKRLARCLAAPHAFEAPDGVPIRVRASSFRSFIESRNANANAEIRRAGRSGNPVPSHQRCVLHPARCTALNER